MNPRKVPNHEITPCASCKIPQHRIRTNYKPTGQYVFRDENGAPWRGRFCPPCGKKIQIAANRKHAKKIKPDESIAQQKPHRKRGFYVRTNTKDYTPAADEGPNHPLYFTKMRSCRTCNEKTINYFNCSRCTERRIKVADEAWGFSG